MLKKSVNSASAIARVLGAEGFTPHIVSMCESYAKRKVITDRQRASFERIDAAFGKIMAGLEEGDRLVVGKFVNFQKAMAFHSGLNVGLGAFAQMTEKEIETASGFSSVPGDK